MKVISITAVLVLIAAIVGWCMNLVALINGCVDFTAASNWVLLLLRAVGVFVAPVGAVLGLFF